MTQSDANTIRDILLANYEYDPDYDYEAEIWERDNKKIRILIADDNAQTRESLKKLLSSESDFEVVDTTSNEESTNLAKSLIPDVIIMDVDGFESCQKITKAIPTNVIIMSVQDDPDHMQDAMLAGACFFLSKPVNIDKLYTTIRTSHRQYQHIRTDEFPIKISS